MEYEVEHKMWYRRFVSLYTHMKEIVSNLLCK